MWKRLNKGWLRNILDCAKLFWNDFILSLPFSMLHSPDCQVQQCTFSVFLAVAERINFNTLTTFCSHYFATFSRQSTPRENVYLSFLYLLSRDVLLASRCSYCNAKSWTLILLCCCCCLTKFPKQEKIIAVAGQCKQLFHLCRWLHRDSNPWPLRHQCIVANPVEVTWIFQVHTWDNCFNWPASVRIIFSIYL